MTEYLEQTAAKIQARLNELAEEQARLEQARDVLLDDGNGRVSEPTTEAITRSRPARRRQGTGRRGGRPDQALALIESQPGITAAELSRAMGSTYVWTLVKKLWETGEIKPCGEGWQVK